MHPKVVIIIVNWNGKQDSLECLRSVQKLTYTNVRVVFVDNGSSDGSVSAVSKTFPDIKIFQNDRNLGFAEGNNIGIKWALQELADYVFLLNNDTILDSDILEHLVGTGERFPNAGILGPKVYYYDRPQVLYSAGANITYGEFVVRPRGYNQKDVGQYEMIEEVDFIVGCGLLIKQEVVTSIGLLDTFYFSYFEDVDLCVRARAHGYKVLYVPTAKMWHRTAASTGGDNNPRWTYLMSRSAVLFLKKYGTIWNWTKFFAFVIAELCYGILKNLFFRRKKFVNEKIRGLIDGFYQNKVDFKYLRVEDE